MLDDLFYINVVALFLIVRARPLKCVATKAGYAYMFTATRNSSTSELQTPEGVVTLA